MDLERVALHGCTVYIYLFGAILAPIFRGRRRENVGGWRRVVILVPVPFIIGSVSTPPETTVGENGRAGGVVVEDGEQRL